MYTYLAHLTTKIVQPEPKEAEGTKDGETEEVKISKAPTFPHDTLVSAIPTPSQTTSPVLPGIRKFQKRPQEGVRHPVDTIEEPIGDSELMDVESPRLEGPLVLSPAAAATSCELEPYPLGPIARPNKQQKVRPQVGVLKQQLLTSFVLLNRLITLYSYWCDMYIQEHYEEIEGGEDTNKVVTEENNVLIMNISGISRAFTICRAH